MRTPSLIMPNASTSISKGTRDADAQTRVTRNTELR